LKGRKDNEAVVENVSVFVLCCSLFESPDRHRRQLPLDVSCINVVFGGSGALFVVYSSFEEGE